jgi:hypothetical protein
MGDQLRSPIRARKGVFQGRNTWSQFWTPKCSGTYQRNTRAENEVKALKTLLYQRNTRSPKSGNF